MKEPNVNKAKPANSGFFTRIFKKMDHAIKAKADEASKKHCCGGDKNDKNGKCC